MSNFGGEIPELREGHFDTGRREAEKRFASGFLEGQSSGGNVTRQKRGDGWLNSTPTAVLWSTRSSTSTTLQPTSSPVLMFRRSTMIAVSSRPGRRGHSRPGLKRPRKSWCRLDFCPKRSNKRQEAAVGCVGCEWIFAVFAERRPQGDSFGCRRATRYHSGTPVPRVSCALPPTEPYLRRFGKVRESARGEVCFFASWLRNSWD